MKGPRIGEGRTAEIFAWGEGQILKLFWDSCPPSWVEYEAEVTDKVHALGVGAPAVEGVVEIEGRRGIVMECVEGPSMLKHMMSRPWTIGRYARMLGEMHAAMHRHPVSDLPSQRQQIERKIRAAPLSLDMKEAALAALRELPDDTVLCHGDFHPDNILMSPRGPIIIDWMDATQGSPLADVARTSLLFQIAVLPPGTPGRRLIALLRASFHRAYLRRYLKLRPAAPERIEAWRLPVAAARLEERIAEEEERLLSLVQALL